MPIRFRRSLAFRLTVLYALACSISLLFILTTSYFVLRSTLDRRLDEHLINEVEEYGLLLLSQDIDVLRDVLRRETESEGTDRMFFRLLDRAGEEILSTDISSWPGIPSLSAGPDAKPGQGKFSTMYVEGDPYARRVYAAWVTPQLLMQVGESQCDNAELLRHFRQIFSAAIAAFLLCSILVGAIMARRALAGIFQVTRTARRIMAGEWSSRVSVSRKNDEIDQLAETFNAMVDRIEVLIRELREVTDDIAHDLRTPLSRVRAAAESDLRNATLTPAHHEAAGAQLEECDRMLALVNTMLEISHTENGLNTLVLAPCNISALVAETAELFQTSAEDKQITLTATSAANLEVDADISRLRRALGHVVDNAVKYTPPNGTIRIECHDAGNAAIISVQDTGPGIPPASHEKIFTRFYRGDSSRTASGNGLGLSLARAICREHGGDIAVYSEPGKGARFELSLPTRKKGEQVW